MSVSRSIAWSMGGQIGGSAIALAGAAILGRLLTPVDYGAFAFATSVYGIVQWLLQMGLGAYVLRERDLTTAKLETAFAAALLQGLAACAIVLATAPLAGWFVHSTTVGWVTAIVAFVPLLASAESVVDALWLRRDRFRNVATLQLAKAAVQLACSLTAELVFHWGAYALAAGLIGNGLTSCVVALYTLRVRQRLRPRLHREVRGALGAFGGRSLLLTLAQVGSTKVPDLLIGRLLNLAVLGHYNRGVGALDLVSRSFQTAVSRAVAPRFFERARSGHDLAAAVTDFIDKMLFCCLAPVAGVAVIAAPLVHLVYRGQWGLAAHALPFLCLIYAFDIARSGGMEVFVVHDRIGANTRLELVRAGYAMALVVLGAHWGLDGVLWARVAEAGITFAVYMVAMHRFGAVAWKPLMRVFAVNGLLAAAAAMPAAWVMAQLGWPRHLAVAQFVLVIGSGAAGWLAALVALRHPAVTFGWGFVRRRLATG